jgi:methylated-DNA-[protein]-cysteine S-methyltransferase
MTRVLQLFLDQLDTPVGRIFLAADTGGNLRATHFTDDPETLRPVLVHHYGKNGFSLEPAENPHGLTAVLESYFAGDLAAIDRIPVKTTGTDFQQKVWRALRDIPCGTTTSYGRLAELIGHPAAVRAVGLANGANPIGVVVPCHRVIGSNGSLTGYGGGIERKRWLLKHESKLPLFA